MFRVFVVDDNAADLCLLRMALAESGIPNTTITLDSGCKAIEIFRIAGIEPCAVTPNLIFLDLNLGSCTGFQVLQAIRSNPHLSSTPIAIISTSQDWSDIVRSYQLKANVYIFKSDDIDESFANIRNAVKFWWTIHRRGLTFASTVRHAEEVPATAEFIDGSAVRRGSRPSAFR